MGRIAEAGSKQRLPRAILSAGGFIADLTSAQSSPAPHVHHGLTFSTAEALSFFEGLSSSCKLDYQYLFLSVRPRLVVRDEVACIPVPNLHSWRTTLYTWEREDWTMLYVTGEFLAWSYNQKEIARLYMLNVGT